ncbi:peptidase inhibitor family I36 protein [Streptomyces sp. NPDC004288]|uniref:peptidase inhibitor family I36 protein n=1 Tax=unclassified Streptomyces TaxID=2593676 RepID=UPI00368F059A
MSTNSFSRRLAVMAAAGLAITGAALATAAPASATGKNGNLEYMEFGLFYNSNQAGCVFDLYVQDNSFSDDVFKGAACHGVNQVTNDNTASYINRDTRTWYVYTNANFGGTEGSLPANYVGNASSTFKNQISSAL